MTKAIFLTLALLTSIPAQALDSEHVDTAALKAIITARLKAPSKNVQLEFSDVAAKGSGSSKRVQIWIRNDKHSIKLVCERDDDWRNDLFTLSPCRWYRDGRKENQFDTFEELMAPTTGLVDIMGYDRGVFENLKSKFDSEQKAYNAGLYTETTLVGYSIDSNNMPQPIYVTETGSTAPKPTNYPMLFLNNLGEKPIKIHYGDGRPYQDVSFEAAISNYAPVNSDAPSDD